MVMAGKFDRSDAASLLPGVHESLGRWLQSVRSRYGLSQTRQAQIIGISASTLRRWESDRVRPRLRNLRSMRDALSIPSRLVEDVVARFYRPPDTDVSSISDTQSPLFWAFIRATVGSDRERSVRDRIVADHSHIARSTARRFASYADFDDLFQMAMIGIVQAVPGYIPTVGPFVPYARVFCRGSILGYLSDRYYEGVPKPLRQRFTAVRRVIQRGYQINGGEPSEETLMKELGLTARQVTEARYFLSQRHTSLDAAKLGSARTLHDSLGTTQAEYLHTELVADVQRQLEHAPEAANLVVSHVLADEPLEVVAARMSMPVANAKDLLAEALKILRPHWSEAW